MTSLLFLSRSLTFFVKDSKKSFSLLRCGGLYAAIKAMFFFSNRIEKLIAYIDLLISTENIL